MKLLWLDLNKFVRSSLALPALHAQIANNTDIEWCTVSATINETPAVSSIKSTAINRISLQLPIGWFNHEQLLHIVSRKKHYYLTAVVILGGPEFLGR